ncbi:MAG: protein kinase [Anaerolinea sp.]|nr:protein kinase [Anaerolinea sp.]
MDAQEEMVAGRFTLQALISQSQTAEVYRAVDCETGQLVAVKRVLAAATDFSVRRRFDWEAKILKQLDHPHIVKLLQTVKTASESYLVLPYYGGGSLADLLAQQDALPLDQVLQIGIALAKALHAVHRQHVTHSDVKPGNVLFSETGVPYLADFGAARHDQGKRFSPRGTILGTYEYLSPEACNRDVIDARADIWSLGVVLYEMVTGRRPFQHTRLPQLLVAIMTDPPPDLQQLRPELGDRFADLIYRMLAKDPNQRIPDIELVAAELTAIWQTQGALTEVDSELDWPVGPAEPGSTTGELAGPQHNLPIISTLFVGRQQEMAELQRLLLDPGYRLLTLHGPGGIGKTRLALQVAQRYLAETQADVFMVDLTAVDNADMLVTAVAETIQYHFFGREDPELQLLNYLQAKRMLLVLDNFEHVVTRADLLSKILVKALDVQILVTSQERLNIREEWIVPLRGLPVTDPLTAENGQNAPAVELFIQTARRLRRDYAPGAAELASIQEICRLVEGSPLAIELAAGLIDQMPPADIAARLRQSFAFLATDLDQAPARQRSTRSVFEYSWALLNQEEQQAARRLSVFRGHFSLNASRRVVGASIPTLYRLIDKALLRRSPVSGRFNVQALLREFAAQKLAEHEAEQFMVRARHAEYYLANLHDLLTDLRGERQAPALQIVEREINNIRAAWQWAVVQADARLLDLATEALFSFYQLRGLQREGAQSFAQAAQALQQTVAEQDSADTAFCRLLARQGVCNRFIGRLEEARALLQQSLAFAQTLGDLREMAFSLYQLGAAMPNEPGVMAYWEESLTVAETLHDEGLIAEVLNWLAFGLFQEGRFDEAVAALERSLAARRALRDQHGLAHALTNLGVVQIHLGNYAQAEQFLQEGLQIYQQLGDVHGVAAASNNLSHTALNVQNYEAAQRWGQQALRYFRRVGDKKAEGEALGNLGTVALHQEDYDVARSLYLQCIALYRELGLPTSSYYKDLGRIALAQQAFADAQVAFQQALREEPHTAVILDVFIGIAALWAQNGRQAQAVSLLQFVRQHPVSEQIVRDRAAAAVQSLAAMMGASAFTAAQHAGKEKNLNDWLSLAQQ